MRLMKTMTMTVCVMATFLVGCDDGMVRRAPPNDLRGDVPRLLAETWCDYAAGCGLTEPVEDCYDRFTGVLAVELLPDVGNSAVDACLASIDGATCGGDDAGWGPDCWALLDRGSRQ